MNEPGHRCFGCQLVGVTFDNGVKFEEKTQPDGVTKYWVATQAIRSIFGSDVEGECQGIGRTKEQALERLKEDQRQLSESLFV